MVSLGKRARSIPRTLSPFRASSMAKGAPEQRVPTTRTSYRAILLSTSSFRKPSALCDGVAANLLSRVLLKREKGSGNIHSSTGADQRQRFRPAQILRRLTTAKSLPEPGGKAGHDRRREQGEKPGRRDFQGDRSPRLGVISAQLPMALGLMKRTHLSHQFAK